MTPSPVLYVSFEELCRCVSLQEERVLELVEQEIVTPVAGAHRQEWRFSMTAISILKRADRLHHDLAVDWTDMPLILTLIEEVETLRAENDRLKQRLSRFLIRED